MCGIAGYFGQGDREILSRMAGLINYRGPDDEGFYANDKIGFAHRRLSIIDLSGGHQPIANEDNKIRVIYNGEIYNYKELRDELKKFGHQFKTESDTEVIVHSYEQWGVDCFHRLNGMFAVAIWDERQEKLVLARDRYGEKPLYWSKTKNGLIFASEIKSILAHPLANKNLNHLAVYQFFSFDYVPQPATIFNDIFKLENGSFLIFQNGEVKIENFYEIKFAESKINFASALSQLEDLLRDSVERRLTADVPVGVFLSGGIDSSTVAYFAKKIRNDLKTISIGFSEPSFDESLQAKQVAKFLKTEHYHKEFKSQDLIEIVPEIIAKLDEPFGDPSILPTFLLARFARQVVKVALGGDGGDELLMGYPNHQVQKIISRLGLSDICPKGDYFRAIENLLPVSDKNLTFFYKAQRYCHSLGYSALYRDFLSIGGYIRGIENMFNFKLKEPQLFNFAKEFLKEYPNLNYLQKVNLLFLKFYLQDDILFKVDRAGMYNGLEVRAPFLDYRLADFLNSLPLNYKLRGWQTKYLLKELMKDKLSREIVYRKKKGFGVPLTAWLRNELKDYTQEILSESEIKKYDLINYSFVEKLIAEHLGRKRDNRKILWNLIIFQNWCKKYL